MLTQTEIALLRQIVMHQLLPKTQQLHVLEAVLMVLLTLTPDTVLQFALLDGMLILMETYALKLVLSDKQLQIFQICVSLLALTIHTDYPIAVARQHAQVEATQTTLHGLAYPTAQLVH